MVTGYVLSALTVAILLADAGAILFIRTSRLTASASNTRGERTRQAGFLHPPPDKTSRLRPRHVVLQAGLSQAYEPEVPVEVREWIAPAPSPPDFVLEAQPPAQPHRRVSIERSIRLADGSYREVVVAGRDERDGLSDDAGAELGVIEVSVAILYAAPILRFWARS